MMKYYFTYPVTALMDVNLSKTKVYKHQVLKNSRNTELAIYYDDFNIFVFSHKEKSGIEKLLP